MPDREIPAKSGAQSPSPTPATVATPANCASFTSNPRDHNIEENRYVSLAGGLGFEPRLAESESH
jgi:hypothetical protein